MNRELGIGLFGCGTVGAEVVRSLVELKDVWTRRYGVTPIVRRVAVRDLARGRDCALPASVFTTKPDDVVNDPAIAVVVEATGRVEEARSWLERSLDAGKHVVTANKALLARHMGELEARARKAGRHLVYEAAVAGGIPLLRAMREGLAAYDITSVVGILNGTTHYMLSRMELEMLSFDAALQEAQRLGFAEPDPTDDVSGEDAGCKLAVLARVALGLPATRRDVFREGISLVRPVDLRLAARLGYRVKPLAVARRSAIEKMWELRVHPGLVAADSPLGRLQYEENGIRVATERRGDYFFSGRGAGGPPTAGAILSDILETARRPGPYPEVALADTAAPVAPEHFVTGHYIRMRGEVSAIRKVLEENDVRVLASLQEGDEAALVTGCGTSASILSPLSGHGAQPPAAWLRVETEAAG